MSKGIVVVTGPGLREAERIFTQPDPATLIEHNGKQYKMNAAAGTAVALSKAGYQVYMIGHSEEYLQIISEKFLEAPHHYKVCDLLDRKAVDTCVQEIEQLKEKTKKDVHLVFYGGVSGKGLALPKETVALDPWEVPPETVGPITEANTTSWFNILQALRSTFKKQKVTKMILISAISAIRTKRKHSLDAIQKSAVHAMARSLALDLTPENIFITEIMPGITDTGFYDPKTTFDAMILASKEFGYDYTEKTYPVFKAERIGEAIVFVMDSPFHVRELVMMPFGQYPHLGA